MADEVYLFPLPEAVVGLMEALPGRDVVAAVETGGVHSAQAWSAPSCILSVAAAAAAAAEWQ